MLPPAPLWVSCSVWLEPVSFSAESSPWGWLTVGVAGGGSFEDPALAQESVCPAGVSLTDPLTTVLGGSCGLALAWRVWPADELSGAWEREVSSQG